MKSYNPFFLILCITLTYCLFFPGLMSIDSMWQYRQAMARSFDDTSPPLMAILLSMVMGAGADLGLLMLAQCCLGILGLWSYVDVLMRNVSSKGRPRNERLSWPTALITLFMLSPLTPFSFYVMTFWKDSWVMIMLLWIGALAFRSGLAKQDRPYTVRPLGELIVIASLAGLLGHVRHNAIILMPPLYLMCLVVARRRHIRYAACLAPLPVAFLIVFHILIWSSYKINHSLSYNPVKALDLVGICVLAPHARNDLPYTSMNLKPKYSDYYEFGSIGSIRGKAVNYEFAPLEPFSRDRKLDHDYWLAMKKHPFRLIKVKIRAFLRLLGPLGAGYPGSYALFQDQIVENDVGLESNMLFAKPRYAFVGTAWRVLRTPIRWILDVHGVWLATTIVLFTLNAFKMIKTGFQDSALETVWLSAILFYYAGFFFAVPSLDFRFMYPATAAIQGYVFAVVVAKKVSASQTPEPARPEKDKEAFVHSPSSEAGFALYTQNALNANGQRLEP